MSAKNPRINITLEETTVGFLNQLALHEKKSVASLARELILESLERREDRFLSVLAEQRDHTTDNRKRLGHTDAWS